jgi:2-methylcitrate dehydratase
VTLLVAVADYAASFAVRSESDFDAARQYLIEALARGFESLRDPACAALMAPLVPGASMPGGARVPGTSLELDPAQAAFCLGVMLCPAASGDDELDVPSGCAGASLGAVLATADYVARKATMEGRLPPTVRDVLGSAVKALEIQGVLAPARGEPRAWTASIRRARVAATAVATAQLGGHRAEIVTALGYASLAGELPVDAEARGLAPRKWATAEAMSRAVRHACQAIAWRSSSAPTALADENADFLGGFLGAKASTPGPPLRTECIARLAERRSPQETAQLALRFQRAVARYFPARQAERIRALFAAPERLDELPVNELLAALVTNGAR